MAFEKIQVEEADDIGVITLNDPSTLNALTAEMLDELDAAFERLSASSRAILLTAQGRVFSAGASLGRIAATLSGDGPPDPGARLESHVNPLLRKLASLPIPWISAVNGAAAGVGCSIALAADIIVAGESAFFLQAFTRIGLAADGGATWLLPRAVGRVRAMEMMLLGDRLPARVALQWGLINRVAPDAELQDLALQLAKRLAAGPTKALGLVRRLTWRAADCDWSEALDAERAAQRELGRTQDLQEGVRAFQDKQAPRFVGA